MKQHKTHTQKRNICQLILLIFKHELLQISVGLQTAFAAETHLAVGHWLEERVSTATLRMFRGRTRIPTVLKAEGQYLASIKTFIEKKKSIDMTTPVMYCQQI
jgi:hypothetical protein